MATGLLLAACIAAGASAQQELGDDTGVDTVVTPRAEGTQAWIRVAGAEFGVDKLPAGSATPLEAELYTVAFRSSRHGFAGGSQCKTPAGGRTGDDLTGYLEDCAREPVIYEYVKTATEESWRPVLPPEGDGYVGGIAFLPGGRALAVGGTGDYPKRETVTSAADDLDPTKGGAGSARAWIYDGQIWTEITDDRMREGMRGLTAVATSPRVSDCRDARSECGLAGGYRQMWLWQDGRFVDGWDTAPPADTEATRTVRVSTVDASNDGDSFRFRVRAIEFIDNEDTTAIAVTSGCCDSTDPTRNVGAALVFDGEHLYAREYGASASLPGADPVAERDIVNGVYDIVMAGSPTIVTADDDAVAPHNDGIPAQRPSRVYATSLPSPGGQTFSTSAFDQNRLVRRAVSTMRFAAGAGTSGGRLGWTVGSLGDGRGIAYDPTLDREAISLGLQELGGNVLKCPGGGWGLLSFGAPELACEPYDVPGGYLEKLGSAALFRLPSYGLNAMAFTDDTESVGWAVGDRGAIVRLGGVGTTSAVRAEPPPAKLGANSVARLPGSEVYDAFRPLPTDGDAAPVPSLVSNGTRGVERPELVTGGSPNPSIPDLAAYSPEDIQTVVMSRDGSEGWALGADSSFTQLSLPQAPAIPTAYYYDGSRWSRCDIHGIPGILPADPACESLADLFGKGLTVENVVLRHAARVPLENDSDPSNDDEFEVFAIGTDHSDTGQQTPLRYRNGRWAIDEAAMKTFQTLAIDEAKSVAFTSPDDGWVTHGSDANLIHWDGEDWANCETAPARQEECGDARNRLPLNEGPASLVAAGERVYFAATRIDDSNTRAPVILYKDRDGEWTSKGGGYDPGCDEDANGCVAQQVPQDQQGLIRSITVSADLQHGWALGEFDQDATPGADTVADEVAGSRYYLLRLSGGVWSPHRTDDAASDYLAGSRTQNFRNPTPVILDSRTGTAAIYMTDVVGSLGGPPVLLFEPGRERWRVMRTPFENYSGTNRYAAGRSRVVAPDGRGGAWFVGKQNASTEGREAVYFWHYTNDVPNEVFSEAPHPIRERITGGAAGADGSFWVTTNSGFIYRYDRLTGWDKLRIPGWDPGRVVTRSSEANSIAIGPDGEGLVVGKNGRIAQVSALGVRLDPAAGEVCDNPSESACGTGRDLRAVDVAQDGSALAGGDASTLLYRPPGGEFSKLDWGGSDRASIAAISMPTGDRAWLADSLGQVYAGTRTGDSWTFSVENTTTSGDLLSRDARNTLLGLNAIEIDTSGEGYAVGERGLILERRDDGSWQRLKTDFSDTFRSVTLASGGRDEGVLIGGDAGLILTLEDGDFRVAREADLFDSLNYGSSTSEAGRVRAVAMIPGTESGEIEAWAVQQGSAGPPVVLHYSSDPDNVLLRPGGRAEPLPDTPAARDGEIAFAAFGRSECQFPVRDRCGESGSGGGFFNEVVAGRVAKDVIERAEQPGGPDFAVFTGDVGQAAGRDVSPTNMGSVNTPLDKSWAHRRWTELVANRFADAEVPLFGAVGRNDLDRTGVCVMDVANCYVDANEQTRAGLTMGWRRAFADMPAPWGNARKRVERDGLLFRPVDASGVDEPVLDTLEKPQARTHYAVDVRRGSDRVARLIVLDNSMGTLQASDPNQNPVEVDGGQLTWLDRMLGGVDHEDGQQAIVLMNTPTYSYQAGDPTTWARDATALETTFMQNDVKMVVSGRLGWNGRAWATSPGVHHPCPDGAYVHDDDAPEPDQAPCEEQTAAVNDPAGRAGDELANALQGLGAPAPPGEDDVTAVPGLGADDSGLQGLLPTVVAASAGGRFGPQGNEGGAASDGWWHGYTIIRMDESGDPRKTIVEQRPIFDWISITGSTHVLKPRQRMALRGEGREPVGVDVAPRYDTINSHAITHRYDLVLADEKNPSLPRKDASGNYVEVPTSVGTIDRETGVVNAGAGRQERTYTVAILSVRDKTATWPIAFEPAKSFKARPAPAPARSVLNPPARPAQVRPPLPPPVVLNQPPAPTPPGTPPPPVPPINVPPINLPPPPQFPNLPSLPTGTATPAPPPPASPPAPPGNAGALPLSLQAPLTPISIVTTVIPPSPPPVNPAPPGGSAARKEARQRQAATAKSEEGGGDQAGSQEAGGGGESGAAEMTRRDRARPGPSYGESRRDDGRYSFTSVSHSEQASAWSRGALYGGMTIATSLALALGWGIVRPTPKRRHPPQPAPEVTRAPGRTRRN